MLKGEYPASAYGLGGRQSRTDPKLGNIFDHHTVVYEYKSGARVVSMCRQFTAAGVFNEVSDHVVGTKGSAELMKHTIDGRRQGLGVRRARTRTCTTRSTSSSTRASAAATRSTTASRGPTAR